MLLHCCWSEFKLSFESFEICNQVANQLIIPLKQKLELHYHIYLLNVPQKKTILNYEHQLSIYILETCGNSSIIAMWNVTPI